MQGKNVYQAFDEIIGRSFEPAEKIAAENWADEMFRELDYSDNILHSKSVSDCPWENEHCNRNVPFDWDSEGEFDFEDPPEFSL